MLFFLIALFFVCEWSHSSDLSALEDLNLGDGAQFEKAELKRLDGSEVFDSHGKKYPLTWGEFDPGKGILLGKNDLGSMSISFYVLARYLNQQPPTLTFEDHLGRERVVDTRNDIELHRIMIWLRGFAYDPKLSYLLNIWNVNSTKSIHVVGNLAYEFDRKLNLQVGVDGLPAIRSFNGQHPYFLGTDRQLGDEFFKAGFTMGLSAYGQLSNSVFYRAMVGNSFSEIGIPTSYMTRDMAYGASIWVLPTGEFGPRGGYGDYEMHQNLATRFGISVVTSREDGYKQPNQDNEPKNTAVRLSDGLNFFSVGALAPGVQVGKASVTIASADAALKYRGFFLDLNYYTRWINHIQADGTIPDGEIFDHGYMIQIAKQVKPQKWEIYSAYSYIWGEFNNPWEIALGVNYYPRNTRNWRLNMMVNHIEESPVDSQFGYYVGGQTGETLALATDVFF